MATDDERPSVLGITCHVEAVFDLVGVTYPVLDLLGPETRTRTTPPATARIPAPTAMFEIVAADFASLLD
jgi:hypothetical protein